MRRRVVVTGAGVLSPLADSPAGLQAALLAGESGCKEIELFPTSGLATRAAGEIRPFDPKAYLGDRNLRPIDRTSRLLLVAAGQALAASGWSAERRSQEDVGLVLGTNFCSLRTIAEFDRRGVQLGPSYASPFDFANSVINAAAGQTAIWYGLRGVNSTVSAGEASGLAAIAQASDLIAGGRAEALLAGGVEELCFESVLGFERAGRLAVQAERRTESDGLPAGAVPFAAGRSGFTLAEGAALVCLESAERAAARGARVLAEVLGHGEAFDAERAPGSLAAAVERAVRAALADSGLGPADVDAVSASANGSVLGDREEARGLAAALGARAAAVPVTAIKAMLGEAVGASGGLQAVAMLETLQSGELPGIRGLAATEDGFPLGGARPESRRIAVRRALLLAVGGDGQTAAVVIAAPEEESM
jgi:3-oxoacyl-[acyl-carrier-protein] synthase II